MKSNISLLVITLVLAACGNSDNSKSDTAQKRDKHPLPESSFTSKSEVLNGRMLRIGSGVVQDSGQPVIVNAANEWMAYGSSGGSHQHIVSEAGSKIIDADVKSQKGRFFTSMGGVDDLGGTTYILNPGEAMTTTSGILRSKGIKHIIHGVGPQFPSSGDIAPQLETLRHTYTAVFNEMDKLHSKDNNINSVALMPVSSGIFSGSDANVPHICDILIDSTFHAMTQYEWLQTSIYAPGFAYEMLKSRIKALGVEKYVQEASSSSKLSAGITMTNFALLDAPAYHAPFGIGSLSGAATNIGSFRVMGSRLDATHHKTAQLAVGCVRKNTFVGAEFESSWNGRELGHYAIKAMGIWRVSDLVAFSAGIGYISENVAAGFTNNIRSFFYKMGVSSADFTRSGTLVDFAAQWNVFKSNDVSMQITVGARSIFGKDTTTSFYKQSTIHLKDSKFLVGVSSELVSLSLFLEDK